MTEDFSAEMSEVQISGPFGNELEICVQSGFNVGDVDGGAVKREVVGEGAAFRVDDGEVADVEVEERW